MCKKPEEVQQLPWTDSNRWQARLCAKRRRMSAWLKSLVNHADRLDGDDEQAVSCTATAAA